MQKKKETSGKSSNNNNRNTSYYKSRVGKKPKTESSAFLDRAKKRQFTSYKMAMLVLVLVMIPFTGLIFLGSWLNSLVGTGEFDPTEPGVNPFTSSPHQDDSEAMNVEDYFTTEEPQPVFDVSEIFYNYNGVYLDIEKLDSLESLQQFIDNVKSKGINAVNIDVKKEDGTILYPINGQTAAIAGEANYISLPIKGIINILHQNELYVSGTIACFKDSLASTTYVDFALRDSSAAAMRWEDADGSYWLNAYTEGAREYITGIVADSAKLGFDEIILSWFFFPNVANEKSVSYEDNGVSKYSAIKDFVTAQRYALDDIAPKVKLGLSIPLTTFLSIPNDTMGLNPGDLADRCNFFATSFAPAHVPSGIKVNDDLISNPESDPHGTVKSLCAHFKYLSDITNFRPYIQAFNQYGDDQIQKQKQALYDSDITMWQLINFDNDY